MCRNLLKVKLRTVLENVKKVIFLRLANTIDSFESSRSFKDDNHQKN